MEQFERTVIFDYAEVKAKWLSLYNGDSWKSQPGMESAIQNYRKGQPNASWYGATPDQMAEWLRNGFTSPEFPVGDDYMPRREARRMVFGEEGELDLTLAWSGHDYPYLDWERVERKPGIRIIADLDFNGMVRPAVIAEYGAWLAGLLSGLETMGYDIELDLRTRGNNFTHSDPNTVYNIICRVKRENELSDFAEFSPLFSPSGFRMLIFTMFGMAMDSVGYQINGGLGRAVGNAFTANYDADTGTLDIRTNSTSSSFPMEDMTARVNAEIGL